MSALFFIQLCHTLINSEFLETGKFEFSERWEVKGLRSASLQFLRHLFLRGRTDNCTAGSNHAGRLLTAQAAVPGVE